MTESIKKTVKKGKVEVTELTTSKFQKPNTITAYIKQKVIITTEYPSQQIANDLQDNLFSSDDFEGEGRVYTNETTYVAFLDVPNNLNIIQVRQRLSLHKNCTLYKILSNNPILTDNQEASLSRPDAIMTRDSYANKQAMRFGENSETPYALILDRNGNVQYSRTFFSKDHKEDIDLRNSEDIYLSEELAQELETIKIKSGIEL